MKNKLTIFYLAAMLVTVFAPSEISAKNTNRLRASRNLYLQISLNTQSQKDEAKKDETAEEILAKHVAALGGREAFDSIKSIEIHTEAVVMGNTMTTMRIYDVAGKRTFQKQDSNGRIIEMGFDGAKPWQRTAYFRGFLEASSDAGKAMTRGGINLPGAGLYNYKTDGRTFTRIADEKIGDKNYLVLQSQTTDGAPVRYYFDAATYLIKQTISGSAVTQTQTLDDYRKVGGVTIAFSSTLVNSQVTFVSKITDLKFNQPVDDSIFEFEKKTSSAESASPAANESGANKMLAASGELSESVRLETFESVWKTINDTFYDRTFNGIDWQAMHEKYLPLVKTTTTSDAFHKLLNQMVQEFHLSHFRVLAPEDVATLNSDQSSITGGAVGLSFVWIDNELLVARVKKDSPADLEKIRPGFIVKQIDGKTPDRIYADYKAENKNFQYRENFARARAANAATGGKPETKISFELVDGKNKTLTPELTRKPQTSVLELEFESKKLAGNVGYIKFNVFFKDLLTKFQTALADLKDTKALIIDLRGNPGGAGDLAGALANLLCENPGTLGTLTYRYAVEKYDYKGTGDKAYKGKIFLLMNESSGSTSEVFAAGMQANGRASVVGGQSIGAALPSLAALLPTRGALQYVVSSFQSSNGMALEGRGVTPDFPVKFSRADLLAERDAVLEQALKLAGKR